MGPFPKVDQPSSELPRAHAAITRSNGPHRKLPIVQEGGARGHHERRNEQGCALYGNNYPTKSYRKRGY